MNSETQHSATKFGALDEQEQGQEPQVPVPVLSEEEQQKVTDSHLKLRALSTLRNATTPRDRKLDQTRALPREERLGKPLPPIPTATATVPPAPASPFAVDPAKIQPHPWHRYFARAIDGIVIALMYAAPLYFVRQTVGAHPSIGGSLTLIMAALLCFGLALCYEPFMLSTFGATLGKSLFKIRVTEQRTGEYLSFGRAWVRMWWVVWYSGHILSLVPVIGFMAPFVCQTMQYKKLVKDKITSYDERMKIRYEHG